MRSRRLLRSLQAAGRERTNKGETTSVDLPDPGCAGRSPRAPTSSRSTGRRSSCATNRQRGETHFACRREFDFLRMVLGAVGRLDSSFRPRRPCASGGHRPRPRQRSATEPREHGLPSMSWPRRGGSRRGGKKCRRGWRLVGRTSQPLRSSRPCGAVDAQLWLARFSSDESFAALSLSDADETRRGRAK